MTRRKAIARFREEIMPEVVKRYPNDKPALRQAWNDWTDGLCKDGIITDRSYYSWVGPEEIYGR